MFLIVTYAVMEVTYAEMDLKILVALVEEVLQRLHPEECVYVCTGRVRMSARL